MSEVRRAAVVIAVVVAAAAGVAIWLLRPPATQGVRQSTQGAPDPFDARGRLDTAASRAIFNPRGTRLALLGGRGLGIANQGRVDYILGEATTNVVDAAWLPNTTRLLVAEGPAATGRLSIVGVDGQAVGFVPLEPSVSFGTGRGMTVDEARDTAVVAATVREPLGGEHVHLVAVDLASGRTRHLTTPDGPDEMLPSFAGGGQVVYTSRDENGSWVSVVDVATGTQRRLTAPGVRATSQGVIGSSHAAYTTAGGKVWAVPIAGGDAVLLTTLHSADALVAVDPAGGRVLVARETATGVELATLGIRRP